MVMTFELMAVFAWFKAAVLTIIIVVLSSAFVIAQTERPREFAAKYEECENVLWSYPANTLSELVPQGFGARLSSGRLDDIIPGLHCSDDQIIAYMAHHGLPFHSQIERDDVFEGIQGDYNRILDFCIQHTSFLRRLFSGECGGVTRLIMVDDRVSNIVSHGFK